MKISILLLFGLVSLNSFMAISADNDDKQEIVIVKDKDPQPRSPGTSISIDAYYQGGAIYLQFGENIGCMDVNITNHSTGEQWYDTACSDNVTEVIAISSSLGIYQITLETESGAIYYGSFSL